MSNDYTHFRKALCCNDILTIKTLLFEGEAENKLEVRAPFRREGLHWDFKGNCPGAQRGNDSAWARIAKSVLAFYNKQGGVLVFGVRDKTFSLDYTDADIEEGEFNKKIYKFLDDKIYVKYFPVHRKRDGTYVGIAVVPPRGPVVSRFKKGFKCEDGHWLFEENDIAVRYRDEARLYSGEKANSYIKRHEAVGADGTYQTDKPYFRLFVPDYSNFINRPKHCASILAGMKEARASVISLTGFGGVGKTALATWAVEEAYVHNYFSFIVSITAKDRSLGREGFIEHRKQLSNLDSLLDAILIVLDDKGSTSLPLEEKEIYVKAVIEGLDGLLYVDNLETVEDPKVINFLNDLPLGVKAITTSRRALNDRYVHPVPIEGFTDKEAIDFVKDLSEHDGYSYLTDLSESELLQVVNGCSNIPLAIKWATSRASSKVLLLKIANEIKSSGRSNKELVEFSFRRVFDSFTEVERKVSIILSCHSTPLDIHAISFAAEADFFETEDALAKLYRDGLIKRYIEEETASYTYGSVPITKIFIVSSCADRDEADKFCKLLQRYFDAADIADPSEREIVKKSRISGHSIDSLLIVATASVDAKKYEKAENEFKEIIARYPMDHKGYRGLADLYKRHLNNKPLAIHFYELCLENIEPSHTDYAIAYREYGLLLMHSGQANCDRKALASFEKAYQKDRTDGITLRFLALLYLKTGDPFKVPKLRSDVNQLHNPKTNSYYYKYLHQAYLDMGQPAEAEIIKKRYGRSFYSEQI